MPSGFHKIVINESGYVDDPEKSRATRFLNTQTTCPMCFQNPENLESNDTIWEEVSGF